MSWWGSQDWNSGSGSWLWHNTLPPALCTRSLHSLLISDAVFGSAAVTFSFQVYLVFMDATNMWMGKEPFSGFLPILCASAQQSKVASCSQCISRFLPFRAPDCLPSPSCSGSFLILLPKPLEQTGQHWLTLENCISIGYHVIILYYYSFWKQWWCYSRSNFFPRNIIPYHNFLEIHLRWPLSCSVFPHVIVFLKGCLCSASHFSCLPLSFPFFCQVSFSLLSPSSLCSPLTLFFHLSSFFSLLLFLLLLLLLKKFFSTCYSHVVLWLNYNKFANENE